MKITDYDLDYPEHEGVVCPSCGFVGAGIVTSLCWVCNGLVCYCGKCNQFNCIENKEEDNDARR